MAEKKNKPAELKTKPTTVSIDDFINNIQDEQKRNDSFTILGMMKKATGEEPVLWSNSIIGFVLKRYKSPATDREVDWFRIGFSPRKANLSLHVHIGNEQHTDALKKLGKHKVGPGCLYINKLDDIDLKLLQEIIENSARQQ